MKKSELKEMIKAAFLAEKADGDVVDPYMAEGEEDLDELLARLSEEEVVAEAEEEDVKVKVKVKDEEDVDIDAGEEIDAADTDLSADDEEVETANDSIVVDKKIVSLSSLPSATRKILDTLETLRAEAEEFGDQKFITQVGNTITFFTRDFVVAGDAPNPQGIEEGDGELDVNIDSEKSTAEMEAGLGLEEEVNELFGLFGGGKKKAEEQKKKDIEILNGIKDWIFYNGGGNGSHDHKDTVRKKDEIEKMSIEDYMEVKKQFRDDITPGMDWAQNFLKNNSDALEALPNVAKMAGLKESLNESIFPMWNKIK